jgi:hypothetical protein
MIVPDGGVEPRGATRSSEFGLAPFQGLTRYSLALKPEGVLEKAGVKLRVPLGGSVIGSPLLANKKAVEGAADVSTHRSTKLLLVTSVGKVRSE